MNKVTLCKGNKQYDFIIDKYKIIAGTNYSEKFVMMNILREFFNNHKSLYSENRNLSVNISINDKSINLRKNIFFDISPAFDLDADIKMGTKSITMRYIEAILNDQLYLNSINTISLLFQSLEDEINHERSDIHISLCDFNIKNILKLISTYLVLEDEQANLYNLSYEELIVVLLRMISKITENTLYEEVFILLDLPLITGNILTMINSLNNCKIFIFTNDYKSEMNIKDIYIYSKFFIDLADDHQIYSVFCEEYNVQYELKEIRKMLNNYVNNIKDEYTELISKILE